MTPISRTSRVSCTKCGHSFTWSLDKGPVHKAKCPYCDGEDEMLPPPPKKKRRMLTKAERRPDNKEYPQPTYPQEWFLDFHCRSLNEYRNQPHLRVRDKGAAYRALEKLDIGKVRRTRRKVRISIVTHRKLLTDVPSLWGGSSKGLVDVIVRLGWIHDDSPEWCEMVVDQKQVLKKDLDAGEKRGTLVRLEAIPKPRSKKPKSSKATTK